MITTTTNNTINVEMFIFTLLKLTITNTISILLFSDLKSQTLLEINDDALDGKIDFIITKSVSRFARNTVDSLRKTYQGLL